MANVGDNQISVLTHPALGEALNSAVILGQFQTIRTQYNAHDADPSLHVRTGTLALRPVAGNGGVYVATDTQQGFVDTGAAWAELAYLRATGGTLTGDLLFTDNLYDIGKSGATRPRDGFFARNVTVGGAVSAASVTASGAVSGATLSGTLATAAQPNVTSLGTLAGLTVGGAGVSISAGGLTVTGVLTFATDNSYSIGASGANRPANLYVAQSGVFGSFVTVGNLLSAVGVSATGNVVPGAGQSVDLQLAGGNGYVSAYDHTAAAFIPLILRGLGTTVTLNASGATISGQLLFAADNGYDIGASAASRPRNVYVAGAIHVGGYAYLEPAATTAVIVNSNNTFTGKLWMQAGGGSAGYGGSLIMYGHTSLTKPGSTIAGISINSGGYFGVNTSGDGTGTDVLKVPATGSATLSLGLLFGTDNTFDIGASGANRPRNVYAAATGVFGGGGSFGGDLTVSGVVVGGGVYGWTIGNLINSARIYYGANGANTFSFFTAANGWADVECNTITLVGNLLFATDNSTDIGTATTNRPRNIYAAGTIYSASSRTLKRHIRPTTVDALSLIRDVSVQDFEYRADPGRRKIGFIAEDTDELLSGPQRTDFDVTNAIGLLLRAVQQLDATLRQAA